MLCKLGHGVAAFLVKIGWLEFPSRWQSEWAHFLYTKVCMVWYQLGEHLVSKNGMLPSLPGFPL